MNFPCIDCTESTNGKECRDFLSCHEWGKYYDETKGLDILKVRERVSQESKMEKCSKYDLHQKRL